MKLELQKIKLQNVKSFMEFEYDFKKETIFKGENASGKTTLLEATLYMLTLTGLNGNTYDPKSLTHVGKPVIELSVLKDNTPYVLKYDDGKYYINDMKVKKSEYLLELGFSDLTPMLNVNYVLDMLHWEDARKLFLDTFAKIDDQQIIDKLISLGHTKENVEKAMTHSRKQVSSALNKKKDDFKKAEILMNEFNNSTNNTSELEKQLESLTNEYNIFKTKYDTAHNEHKILAEKELRLRIKFDQIERQLSDVLNAKASTISELQEVNDSGKCNVCDREYTEAQLEPIVKSYSDKLQGLQDNENELQPQLKDKSKLTELQVELNNSETTRNTLSNKVDSLKSEIQQIEMQLKTMNNNYEAQFNLAKQELNIMQSFYDTVVEKDSVVAEMVSDAVGKQLPNLDINWFETLKNGEIKNTFTVRLNGVPYKYVNAGHKMQLKIDITKALQVANGIDAPLFIDGLEAMTTINTYDSQMVGTIAVAGEKLK